MSNLYEDAFAAIGGMQDAAPATSGAPAASPYEDAFGAIQDAQERAAKSSLYRAMGGNPDQAARAQALAPQVGLHPDTVEANLPDIERQVKIQQQDETLRQSPALQRWLTDTANAKIAHDEFDKLGALEKVVRSATVGFGRGTMQAEQGRIGARQLGGQAGADEIKRADDIEAQLKAPTGISGFPSFVESSAEIVGQMLSSASQSANLAAAGGATGAAIGSMGAGPLAPVGGVAGFLVGTMAGFGAGMAADMYKIEAGSAYRDLLDIKDANGNPLDPAAAQHAAMTVGVMNAALEMAAAGVLLKPLGEAVNKAWARNAIREVVTKPTAARALANFGKRYAEGVGAEVFTEVLQEGVNVLAETAAKMQSDGNFQTILDSDTERQAALDRLGSIAAQTAKGMLLLGLPGPGANLVADGVHARRATRDAAFLGDLMTGAADSKTRARNAGAFERFLAQQTDGSPVENVFIPAEKVLELYQKIGVDPFTVEADPLFSFVDDMPQQLREAVATGGDVVVPTSGYVAHLAGSNVHEMLKDDLRIRQDGMSVNEAKEFARTAQDRWEEEAQAFRSSLDEQAAAEDPRQRVHDDAFLKYREAGFTVDAASQYAALTAARYNARAERLGEGDAWTLYDRAGTTVERVLPETLRARPVDQIDLLINELRRTAGKGGAKARQADAFGPTLAEFLAGKGGMKDAGGELAAMDARLWNKDKRFQRRLVSDVGMNLDDAALSAWEAGYFPEFGDQRPDINALLDKLREDIAGRPQYSERGGDVRTADHQAALADLDRMLGELGLSVKAATNEEIKAALAKFQAQPADGGFNQASAAVALDNDLSRLSEEGFLGDGAKFVVKDRSDEEGGFNIYVRDEDWSPGDTSSGVIKVLRGSRTDGSSYYYIDWISNEAEAPGLGGVLYKRAALEAVARGGDGLWVGGMATENAQAAVERLRPQGWIAREVEKSEEYGDPKLISPPRSYDQRADDEARGKVTFDNDTGRAAISLFQKADLSTLLHEMGHAYLEELRADAKASEGARADLDTLLGWFSIDSADKIETEHHEQFARAFEAYLLEGKAPSNALAAAFQKFKAWLVGIYRTVAGLNTPINDEVRGVFDRMIATDEEIAAAMERERLLQAFPTAEAAGMTEAEFAAYSEAVRKAKTAAGDDLLGRVMATERKRREAWWRDEADAVRADVAAEIDRRPDFAALYFLRHGVLPFDTAEMGEALEPVKLSREALAEMYGSDEAARAMPKGVGKYAVVVEHGGVHPDYAAEMLGFDSGDALVQALMSLEDQQRRLREQTGNKRLSLREHLIGQEVERVMLERYGDMLNDGSIQQAALDAIHSDQAGAVLATELRALARKAGRDAPATPLQVAREWAARQVAGRLVSDVQALGRYARDEAKAARAVEVALVAGDNAEAYRQKQRQMLAHVLYSEAKKAKEQAEKDQSMLSRLASKATIKGMEQGYLEQIHGMLERFDFRSSVTQKEAGRRASFQAWYEGQIAAGNEVVVPERLLDDSYKKPYFRMTVDEFRGLADAVRSIAHLGRMKQELIDNKARRDFDEVVQEALEQTDGLKTRDLPAERNPGEGGRGLDRIRASARNFKTAVAGLDAALLKMETVIDWLDVGNAKGVFNRMIFKPLSDAQNRENDLKVQVVKRLQAAFDKLDRKQARGMYDRFTLPELIDSRTGKPTSMTKAEILAMALNVGNAGNLDKLLRGEKWREADVRAVLGRHLTKADWDLVQEIWDTVDSLWPEIEALEKRVSGVAPPKVGAVPVETPHGTYRGGYYPVIYDPNRAHDVFQNQQRQADSLFENNYARATTEKGHTIGRVENYARPLYLSLNALSGHLTQVIHDLAYREAVMQADKFLSDRRIRERIEETMGPEVYKQFRPWLQSIANDRNDQRGLAWWDRFMNRARTNATLVGLGFRMTTMLAQVTGFSDATEVIGARWTASGAKAFFGTPAKMKATRDFVYERSGEMRHRANEMDRDVRDGLRELTGKHGLVADARRFAFYGIAMMDLTVTIPTWMGAYNKWLSENRGDEQGAIYYADKVVRQSAGSGGAKDLAAVQRGPAWQKLTTMFYSYFSRMYNRQRDIGHSYQSAKDLPMVLARSWWLLVVPPLMGALLTGKGPGDDDDWGLWALKNVTVNLFGGIPIVRDAANGIQSGFGYQFTPAARAIKTLGQAGADVASAVGLRDADVSGQWLKHATETAGYVFGLPLGQVGTTVQYLWDVMDGDQRPDGVLDFLRGATLGPPKN